MADHLASTALEKIFCVFVGELRLGTPGFGNCVSRLHCAFSICLPFPPALRYSPHPSTFNHARTLNTPSPSLQHLSSASSHQTRAAYHVCLKSRPSIYTSPFVDHLSNFTLCTARSPALPNHTSSTRFPLPSIASTSRFYWEFLVYIIDQIKNKQRQETLFLLILRLLS